MEKQNSSLRLFFAAVILLAVGLLVVLMALSGVGRGPGVGARGAAGIQGGGTAREVPLPDITGLQVKGARGENVALAPPEGGVVFFVSETCSFCHDALTRIARGAAGDSLPRLYVVTVEGGRAGERLKARTGGARGVWLDPGDRQRVGRQIGIQAVPFLLLVDASGAVNRARVGGLSDEEVEEVLRLARAPS